MIIEILLFISGVIVGALITLNNSRRVRAVAEKLEAETNKLRRNIVAKKSKGRKSPPIVD
jgi:hypothetical protein